MRPFVLVDLTVLGVYSCVSFVYVDFNFPGVHSFGLFIFVDLTHSTVHSCGFSQIMCSTVCSCGNNMLDRLFLWVSYDRLRNKLSRTQHCLAQKYFTIRTRHKPCVSKNSWCRTVKWLSIHALFMRNMDKNDSKVLLTLKGTHPRLDFPWEL